MIFVLKKENFSILVALLFCAKITYFHFLTLYSFKFSVLLSLAGWMVLLCSLIVGFEKLSFGLYVTFSVLLFVDHLHFMNFGNLSSIREIVLIPQVGKLGGNIRYFLSVPSLLFIADIPFLSIFQVRRKRIVNLSAPPKESKGRWGWIHIFVVAFFLISPLLAEPSEGKIVFNKYGFFTYHVHDLLRLFSPPLKGEEPHEVKGSSLGNGSQKKYHGIAAGRNVIVIHFESLQNLLVGLVYNGQEITPNLNKILKKDTIYFANCYQQVGSGNTADAEFVFNTSLHCLRDEVVYEKYPRINLPTLPRIMREKGYYTVAMHGNSSWFWNRREVYSYIGFDDFIALEDFKQDEMIGMGLSDESFLTQAVGIMEKLRKPFYAFLITLSSHSPFILPDSHKKLVLPPRVANSVVGNYFQAVHYADAALGQFLEELKRIGLYQNSVIVIYGDHAGLYPFNKEAKDIMTEILGREYSFLDAFNVPFIVHIPGSGLAERVEITGGQIDFLPTLLNLLGIEYEGEIFLGQDLLNAQHGFAALRYHVPEGSFVDDERGFIVSWDGVLERSEAWDLRTKRKVSYVSCLDGYVKAIQQVEASKYFILKGCEGGLQTLPTGAK